MATEESQDYDGFLLLAQLEFILNQDPLLDEVGFVHPLQLAALHLEGKDSTGPLVEELQESTNKERHLGMTIEDSMSECVTEKTSLTLVDERNRESIRAASYDKSVFWSRGHKLAISVSALLPLFKAAKYAYLVSSYWHKSLIDSSQIEECLPRVCEMESLSSEIFKANNTTLDLKSVENKLLSHSRVMVILSSDYSSAWNSRRRVILQKPIKEVYAAELQLSALVLTYAPKSEQAWAYRRWLIKLIINQILNPKEVTLILERESNLVEKIVERSHMNYRAWRHRCWVMGYMPISQLLGELHQTKKWAQLHAADNCCFHYRRCMLLHLLQKASSTGNIEADMDASLQDNMKAKWGGLPSIWRDELEWNQWLIKHYVGCEALWIHRRFLINEWAKQIGIHKPIYGQISSLVDWNMDPTENNDEKQGYKQLYTLLERESEFVDLCINNSNNSYEDTSRHQEYATTYKMWLIMFCTSFGFKKMLAKRFALLFQQLRNLNGSDEFIQRLQKEEVDLNVMIKNTCPQRTCLWEGLLST